MRVIFVGVHNKPGLTPLCSSTKTGKIIDEIVSTSGIIRDAVVKSNLWDTNYVPQRSDRQTLAYEWIKRVSYTTNDIVVALGSDVSWYLKRMSVDAIELYHPASRRIKDRFWYRSLACMKILSSIKQKEANGSAQL